MIELENIKKEYKIGITSSWALKGVSLKIEKGDFVAFKGPSGSGKTTLLNIIGLLDIPTEGRYILDGKDVIIKDYRQRAAYRKKYLGFIFQTFNLIPELTVFENVEVPLLIMGEKPGIRREKVKRAIKDVGLESHSEHRPGELSGGQMQRVAIARALVKNPPLIIADEPTANLDTKTGTEIIELMKRLNQDYNNTFLFATHDETVTVYMKKIYHMKDGSIVRVEKSAAEPG